MSESVRVCVREGALSGRRCKTPSGTSYLSFQGIPYAKPPLGALRFKTPQPAEPWTGVRDATKFGNQCLQYDSITKAVVGEEDCLFVNVYTCSLPSESNNSTLRPVLFFIHGGAFALGSGDMYGPEPFMEEDVIVVTFNYRLGPLGFLSLGTLEAPGNAGLKDQTMALRWVKENITNFGGDPDNITIFGESAGGASVHFQVLSPLAKGLFQRAIVQSGSAFNTWALAADPAARAQRLAKAAGCDAATAADPSALAKWLQGAPARQLLFATEGALTPQQCHDGTLLAFVPCVEPEHPGAFLPKEPKELLASGSVPPVPLIFGLTSHEGTLFLPEILLQFNYFLPVTDPEKPQLSPEALLAEGEKKRKEMSADLACLLPLDLPGRRDPQRSPQLCQRLKDFFFGGEDLSADTLMGLVHLYSDTQFCLGVLRAARDHARLGSPVYVYEFAFQGPFELIPLMIPPNVKGVNHGHELCYLFNFTLVPPFEEGSPETMVRKRIVRLWADFARGGDPTPSCNELIPTNWLPFSEKEPNFLKISEDLKADTGIFRERMLFWKDLYTK